MSEHVLLLDGDEPEPRRTGHLWSAAQRQGHGSLVAGSCMDWRYQNDARVAV
jgi:hypothetical protein